MTFSFTLSLDGSLSLIETDGAATPVAYVGSGDFSFQAIAPSSHGQHRW